MATAMATASALGTVGFRLYAAGPGRGWLWALVYAEYFFDLAGPAAMGAMFILFPDGRARAGYERRVLAGYAALVALGPTLVLITSRRLIPAVYSAIPARALASPAYIPALGALARPAAGLYYAGAAMGLVGGFLLAVRYRRLTGPARRQAFWPLLAALVVATDIAIVQYLGAFGVLPRTVQITSSTFYAAWVPALLCIPAAIGIALVRYQLFDVRLVVRRSFVYAVLSVAIAGAYLAVVSGAGIAAGRKAPVAVAVGVTIAAVVAFAPVRRRLHSWADRFCFGERVSGYDLLTQFGTTVGHAYQLDELGPQMAATLVRGLDLDWARVSLCLPGAEGVAEPLGAEGIGLNERAEPAVVVPITDAGVELGCIECGPAARRDLDSADIKVITTLAAQAVLAVRNAHLTAELAGRLEETRRQAAQLDASRQRMVAAADTERRRIERNIHDGVQQQIVALAAKLRLARNQLVRDPAIAGQTLAEAQAEAQQTLQDLRELARGIHPTVLSDQGILAAVQSRITRLPIGVRVTAGPELAGVRYPDEIEGAVYFLVCEALVNVLKHAHASQAQVTLSDDGSRLRVEITDDGAGFVPADAAGTGLTGLTDRIEAVGGSLSIRSRPGTGTRLVGELPTRGRRLTGV